MNYQNYLNMLKINYFIKFLAFNSVFPLIKKTNLSNKVEKSYSSYFFLIITKKIKIPKMDDIGAYEFIDKDNYVISKIKNSKS